MHTISPMAAGTSLRIATIGGGNIGGTLARRWLAAGHQVTYGLRSPEKMAGAATIEAAIAASDLVLLAVPGHLAVSIVEPIAAALAGKVVLDATNNFKAASYNSFAAWSRLLPDSEIYRIFNTTPWEVFRDGGLAGEQSDVFYCGPDTATRRQVERLVEDIGLRPRWIGGADQVEVVDGILRLYVAMARQLGRLVTFRLLWEEGDATRL